jgi:hypothetical protein
MRGRAQYLMPKLQGIGLVRSNSYLCQIALPRTLLRPGSRSVENEAIAAALSLAEWRPGKAPCTSKSRSKERTTKNARLVVAPV